MLKPCRKTILWVRPYIKQHKIHNFIYDANVRSYYVYFYIKYYRNEIYIQQSSILGMLVFFYIARGGFRGIGRAGEDICDGIGDLLPETHKVRMTTHNSMNKIMDQYKNKTNTWEMENIKITKTIARYVEILKIAK